MFPAALRVEVAEGVCRVVVPPPVTKAVEVRLPAPTTVTVPVDGVVQTIAVAPPAWDVKTCPAEPAVIGRLKLYVPAADCGRIVMIPLPAPAKVIPGNCT